ncbi:uncharacterized protein PHALS_15313 [Plasmopara halstedii]|uniref:Uncharacterized protein n=1 Tax=Plasmopara halstedii TaxID=4781 RepID=A0A0P1ADT3_PLAHL|nr:uncharacterized protein PHALS_15313 [Plasmopara halstedii]CEG38488.1 hypothetical protein PHALS_15313 [Plasmopara halstedii]|eukprot:XP_024574857.1 hypothetical protein PHALS_15313 [Plasmopara halstedii]
MIDVVLAVRNYNGAYPAKKLLSIRPLLKMSNEIDLFRELFNLRNSGNGRGADDITEQICVHIKKRTSCVLEREPQVS